MRKRVCVVMMASLIGLCASSARAGVREPGWSENEEPAGPEKEALERGGLDLGARIGFSVPLGHLTQAGNLGDLMSGTIPIGLELAIRGNKNVAVGVGFDLAPGLTKNCDPGFSCSATDYRLRVEAIFTARAGMMMDPWLGVGIGYEWLSLSESGMGSIQTTGWDYFNIEVGGEIRLGSQAALGPFVGLSVGEYSSASSGGYSGDITNQSVHEWLQFGVRGTINI